MLGKAGTASCGVINFFKYTTATLSAVVGVSDMYIIGKKNYDAALHGEGLTLESFINDTVRVVLDSTSIAGGIKLAAEPTPWCFVGETLIAYENGQKRIDEIEVGDKVWAYDIETGITELKEVQIVYVHDCDEILHLHTSCGDIDTTSNHPFYVIDKGWVTAGELEIGDEVYRLDGSTAVVIGSELERLIEPIKVYNLEVEDYHTYFVGDVPILVHNYEQKDIDNAVRKVPKKYKELNRCEEFADSLTKKLEKARIPFKKIKVTSNEGQIYSEKYRDVIGIDYHYGIEVDGKVYDNLTLDGMEFSEWLKDMGFGAFKIKTPSGEIVDPVSWEYV